MSRSRCFPECRVRPKQAEIKHHLFLSGQPETYSKVSTGHDNHSVCSLPPFKQHTDKHPPPPPFHLNHFSAFWDHLDCSVGTAGTQSPDECSGSILGLFLMTVCPDDRRHVFCRNHGGSRTVSSRTPQMGLASQSKQKLKELHSLSHGNVQRQDRSVKR